MRTLSLWAALFLAVEALPFASAAARKLVELGPPALSFLWAATKGNSLELKIPEARLNSVVPPGPKPFGRSVLSDRIARPFSDVPRGLQIHSAPSSHVTGLRLR